MDQNERLAGPPWGGYGTLVGTTEIAVGTGKANTAAIVSVYGDSEPFEGRTEYAAKLCYELVLGGKDDWFLPSRNELDRMYANLHLSELGEFDAWSYLSSSEVDSALVWRQDFASGAQTSNAKGSTFDRIRAVRAF